MYHDENRCERNSNIEMLRIISIYLIVICHWAAHGSYETHGGIDNLTGNLFVQCATSLGGIGDVIFVAITGFFQINKSFNMRRLINTIMWINIYSVVGSIFAYMIGWVDSPIDIVHSVPSIIKPKYWFATCWVILYLFSPFINTCYRNQKNNQRKALLLLLFVSTNILYVFGIWGGDFLMFVFWYLIGSEISLSYVQDGGAKKYFSRGFFFFIVYIMLIVGIDFISEFHPEFYHYYKFIVCKQFPLVVIIAGYVLVGVVSLKGKKNIYINRISKSVFAVFLITENPNIHPNMWQTRLLDNTKLIEKWYLIPATMVTAACVVCGCMIIDKLIRLFAEIFIDGVSNKLSDMIEFRFASRL